MINGGKAWFDYEKWSGATSIQHLASFQWNQTYGPLRWPQKGSEVLSVRAKTGHYWKAENLDDFDGTAWVQGPPTVLLSAGLAGGGAIAAQQLPAPSPAAVRKYSETIRVTVQGMRTTDVIGAGQWALLSRIPGGSHRVLGTGAVAADRVLGPGVAYQARVYTPRPSEHQLSTATAQAYPWQALRGYLTVSIPKAGGAPLPVQFASFHTGPSPSEPVTEPEPGAVAVRPAISIRQGVPAGPAAGLGVS